MNSPVNMASVAADIARQARSDTLALVQAQSLARIVADLINDNEPLLKAECDGVTVTVRERGGGAAMRFTVESAR